MQVVYAFARIVIDGRNWHYGHFYRLRNPFYLHYDYVMQHGNKDITYFGETTWRNERRRFGIKQADRLMHTYIIGKTGTGKSTCLETMILQDINAGRGCCLLDPHGDLVEKIVKTIPEWRKNDLIYFNI